MELTYGRYIKVEELIQFQQPLLVAWPETDTGGTGSTGTIWPRLTQMMALAPQICLGPY